MVVEVKDKQDIEKVKELLAKRQHAKKFNAKRFCGAIKFNEDALVIQQRLRDEWNQGIY